MRRLAVALAAIGLGVLVLPAPAGATTYQYWSYWHKAASAWTYSNSGPYYYRPGDGSVEGWHLVRGSGGPSDPPPRVSGSYADLCPTASSAEGTQVAVVVDYGDRIAKTCVTVPGRSSGSAALAAAGGRARYDNSGLLCAINGEPPSGCGAVVPPPTPSPKPTRSPQPTTAAPRPAQTVRTPAGGAPHEASRRPSAASSAVVRSKSAAVPVGPSAAAAASDEASFEPVAQPGPNGGGSTSGGLIVGALLIAALGAATLFRVRRRG